MSSELAEATTKLLDLLSPLDSEVRLRLIRGVLTLLGDDASKIGHQQKGKEVFEGDGPDQISKPARALLGKHNVSLDVLEQYFHIESSSAQVIELPADGKSTKDRANCAYLAAGFAAFIATGDASFTDEQARALCVHFGCYDSTNHTKYIKELGNKLTGSKSTGWKLTAPGLAAFANVLKPAN